MATRNPMVPTPAAPKGMSQEEAMYRGIAMSQLNILKQQMQLGKLNIGSRKITLTNGVEIYCNVCFNKEDVYVNVPVIPVYTTTEIAEVTTTGIIFHPRSSELELLPYTEYITDGAGSHPETKYMYGVKGGWSEGKTLLTTNYIFPLVDSDNASFLVTKPDDGGLAGEFLGETGNYGNLYWWDEDEEDPVYLSWKGTPTRHFRLPNNIDIPGLSIFETSTPGVVEDTPIYTTFGTKLYQSGTVLAEAPQWSWPYNNSGVDGRCLILGACEDNTGTVYIVTQSDHYNAPENVFIFSDGHREEGADSLKQTYLNGKTGVTCVFDKALTKPGFFLTLWKDGGVVDGWSFITEQPYSRTGIPWFANADGTEFVSSNGDKLTAAGIFTANTPTYGSWVEENSGVSIATLVFTADYKGTAFSEFVQTKLVNAASHMTFNSSYDSSYKDDLYETYHGVFDVAVHPDSMHFYNGTTIVFSNPVVVGTQFSLPNGAGPISWSASGLTIDPVTGVVITAPDHCGSVTATNCLGSYTVEVVGMDGVYVMSVLQTALGCGSGSAAVTWYYADGEHATNAAGFIARKIDFVEARITCCNCYTVLYEPGSQCRPPPMPPPPGYEDCVGTTYGVHSLASYMWTRVCP